MFNKDCFQNKYRIKSTRLPHWDYSWPGMYYVTINTKDNIKHFGDIIDGKMFCSPIGVMAKKYWQDIPKHFKNIGLDEYNVMSNHIHGTIVIYETKMNWVPNTVETRHGMSLRDTRHGMSLRKFGYLKPHLLSSIINMYKSSLKRWCN